MSASSSGLSLPETGKEADVGTEKEAMEKETEKEKAVGVKNFLAARQRYLDGWMNTILQKQKQQQQADGRTGELSAMQLRRLKQQIKMFVML